MEFQSSMADLYDEVTIYIRLGMRVGCLLTGNLEVCLSVHVYKVGSDVINVMHNTVTVISCFWNELNGSCLAIGAIAIIAVAFVPIIFVLFCCQKLITKSIII